MGRSGACPPAALVSVFALVGAGATAGVSGGAAGDDVVTTAGADARFAAGVFVGGGGEAATLCGGGAFARRPRALKLTSIDTSVAKDTSSILDSYPSADAKT
jgi:hypothetical protein